MKRYLDPDEAYMLAVEALAHINALEAFVFVALEPLTGEDADAARARYQRLAALSKERIWRSLGHDAIAMQAMLDGLGVDTPGRDSPESGGPPR